MRYTFHSLEGKNVLITGGSGAIGQAIAKGFLEYNANIYLWGHSKIENQHFFKQYQIVDLENIEDIRVNFQYLPDKIDVLINCAGFTYGEKSEEYNKDMWDKTVAINLTAPFLISQEIAKKMKKNKSGSIINITSIGAELGFPENPAYGASKGGLKVLTKSLAYDWAQYGIRINNVGPGYTKTKMTQKSWQDIEKREMRTERMMIKRWAEPEDIVGMVLFLASDMATYITGQDIYIDGGWTAKGI